MAKEEKTKRVDKKHRFPLRIDESIYSECESLSFRRNLSINLLLCEAIKFSLSHPSFLQMIEQNYKRDERKGHFVYINER